MTIKELEKVPFHFVCHINCGDVHTTTYESEDGRLGWCDHVPYKDGEPAGRALRHWRIDKNVYKSKRKFLEALSHFNPNTTKQ